MRKLTKNEIDFIKYEIGGYEIDFMDTGEKLNLEQVTKEIYRSLVDHSKNNKHLDGFQIDSDVRFLGEEHLKLMIGYYILTEADQEMFE
jgi:hypothetical protein